MSVREENTTKMEKVSSGDFSTGAQLTPEQFNDFMGDVQDRSRVLEQARQITVDSESGDIPRMSVGSRILQSVTEGGSGTKQSVSSADTSYATTKVSLPWEVTWETNNEVVDDPEAATRRRFIRQFQNDLEILASVGDTSDANAFVSIEDGWLTVADNDTNTNTYDHQSDVVNKELFNEMKMKLPRRFRNQQSPVFLISDSQFQAYKDYLTDRSTGAGDAMLMTGQEPTPYGYNVMTPLDWPDDRAMFTSMQNLLWIVQNDMRVKSTDSSERNVMNDIDRILNLLAKIDFEIMEKSGCVTASNIAAP